MKIIVCVKQVPMNNNAQVDPETGVMIRSSADTKLNPYDLFALEAALRIRAPEDSVTVLTMGPPAAKAALLECLYMGADKGILVTDRAFAGSDVLTTSYALSQAIRLQMPDLILCGKQTTDGDTAQVGAELSEFLGIPCVANVTAILSRERDGLTVTANLGDWEQKLLAEYPCLITVEKDIFTPRLPSFKRQRALEKPDIVTLTVTDLGDKDTAHYGLFGSPTQVERIFPPDRHVESVRLDSEHAVDSLFKILTEKKYI